MGTQACTPTTRFSATPNHLMVTLILTHIIMTTLLIQMRPGSPSVASSSKNGCIERVRFVVGALLGWAHLTASLAALKVAEEEKSNVLTASAYHHRSDAYSSVVALLAIVRPQPTVLALANDQQGGSWVGFSAADPLGGLLVAGMILLQGAQVGLASITELLDQSADPELATDIRSLLEEERIASLRIFKSGALHLLDVAFEVAPSLTVRETATRERELTKRVKEAFPTITEVAVRFRPASS